MVLKKLNDKTNVFLNDICQAKKVLVNIYKIFPTRLK